MYSTKGCVIPFSKIILVLTFIWMVIAVKPTSAQDYVGNWNTNIKVFLGTKQLNKDDWGYLAGQIAFGIEADFRKEKWPISILTGFVHSRDSKEKFEVNNIGQIDEFIIGARIGWGRMLRFELSGGGSVNYVQVQGVEINDSGIGMGIFIDAGLLLMLGKHFNFGFLYRYTYAQSNVNDNSAQVGGGLIVLTFGYKW